MKAGTAPAESRPFTRELDRILALRWRSSPVTATADGIHDRDGELDRFDPSSIERDTGELEEAIARMRAISGSSLDAQEELDRRAVLGTLEADLHDWREVRSWTWNPSIYPEVAVSGCYLLAVRDAQPLAFRLEALASRLAQVPRLLSEGLANVPRPATLLAESAAELCHGADDLFISAIPALAAGAEPRLRDAVTSASALAARSMSEYAAEVRARAGREGPRSFAIGEAAFGERMRGAHGLEASTDDVLGIASEVRRATHQRLAECAARLDPHRSWLELLKLAQADHPSRADLLGSYRREVERALGFVTEQRIATPTGDALRVVPTPAFERPFLPIAGYLQPAPLEPGGVGLFYVTLGDDLAGGPAHEEVLRRHPLASLPLLVVHEGYPGHHLQGMRARRCGSRARLLYGTPVMWEGWALYCEQMMCDQGFTENPVTTLFQLRDLLTRSWRVDIDVRLQRGEWEPERAVACLVGELGFDPASAAAEVRRYAGSPTQPMSYLIGRELLMDLRSSEAHRLGGDFDLGRFHDRILEFGHLSPALIRGAILGEPPVVP